VHAFSSDRRRDLGCPHVFRNVARFEPRHYDVFDAGRLQRRRLDRAEWRALLEQLASPRWPPISDRAAKKLDAPLIPPARAWCGLRGARRWPVSGRAGRCQKICLTNRRHHPLAAKAPCTSTVAFGFQVIFKLPRQQGHREGPHWPGPPAVNTSSRPIFPSMWVLILFSSLPTPDAR